MAPTRPTRKENGAATAEVGDAPPVKRGRGRPPKNGVAAKEKPAPSGRPRGRPPGSTSAKVTKSTASKAKPKPKASGAAPSGRGRGRPRKSDASTAATPSKSSATPKAGSTGKGRGRPRKSEPVVSDNVPEDDGELVLEEPEDDAEDGAGEYDDAVMGDVMDVGDEDAPEDDAIALPEDD
ncbi:hypothetical protein AAE478_004497 [Parahypoxylon ruwenzoriense]